MGPSGCGKSTLAKLLQGFYLPTEGAIRIDGHDIRHLSANELRRNFGVVPQETVLFSRHDLRQPDPRQPARHASTTWSQACKAGGDPRHHRASAAGLPDPDRRSTAPGLSGGQKQRIAIARALLKRPPILIFDEATSNLDTQTAESFVRTVNRLAGQATVLFITHHLPVGACVDKVVHIGEAPAKPAQAEAEREMLAALRAAPQGVGLH